MLEPWIIEELKRIEKEEEEDSRPVLRLPLPENEEFPLEEEKETNEKIIITDPD